MTKLKKRTVVHKSPYGAQDLPLDLVYPVLVQLTNQGDLYSCSLVSRAFNRFATPLLYCSLHSRPTSKLRFIHHPSTTLQQRPHLAKYVRHITETGAIHRGLIHHYHPTVTRDTLRALRLCDNLQSFTWIDECALSLSPISPSHSLSEPSVSDPILSSFLSLFHGLHLTDLTIHTQNELGESAWSQIVHMKGLRRLSLWCMEGPPRTQQYHWYENLGNSLTHLELGVNAFAYPCAELLSQLPELRSLRLKGAQLHAIPTILSNLPKLESLDTDCLIPSWWNCPLPSVGCNHPSPPLSPSTSPISNPTRRSHNSTIPVAPSHHSAKLRHLTIRTSTIASTGPNHLWQWVNDLITSPGLESFKMYAYALHANCHLNVPRGFIDDLARLHGESLKEIVFQDVQLQLYDMRYLCEWFAGTLERLQCVISSPDIASISSAISPAKKLQTLKLRVHWIPPTSPRPRSTSASRTTEDLMLANSATPLPKTMHMHMQMMQDAKASKIGSATVVSSADAASSPTLSPKIASHYRSLARGSRSVIATATASSIAVNCSTHAYMIDPPIFTKQDAERMMLRNEDSVLRTISIGTKLFTGKWVLRPPLEFTTLPPMPTAPTTRTTTAMGSTAIAPHNQFSNACDSRLKFIVEETLSSDGWHS